MTSPLLSAQGVSKNFGGMNVLRDAWIKVEPQSIVGLIGPNGAGKSTFFSVLSGFLAPNTGEIRLGDAPLQNTAPNLIAQQGLVRTFQTPREFAQLTALENMLVARPHQLGDGVFASLFRPGAVRRQELANRERAESLLEFLGLSAVKHTPAGALSGGQKKLLELGRALMLDPKIVLLDEPFAGVNPSLINTIIDRIFALRGDGLTFLIVEHNMKAISTLSDVLFVMVEGSILTSGQPEVVTRDPQVLTAYLGGHPTT
ncbi:ABC transporter ATP-binding protein [Deinococcus sp. SM5_A1]|uniref:ABC transporter ATP-binding protein n=1 Tax=Deinococcus sp. SM5_A1 TaxID=3379094 RepID=UPI003858D3AF